LILGGHRRARTGIANQIPSGEIPVAAVVGIGEHTFQRQPARAHEECGINHVAEYLVPLLNRKVRQRRAVNPRGVSIHGFQALEEVGFLVRVGPGQDTVDIDLGARFDGSWTKVVTRDQSVDESHKRFHVPWRQGALLRRRLCR
jgi:hypothetical protein